MIYRSSVEEPNILDFDLFWLQMVVAVSVFVARNDLIYLVIGVFLLTRWIFYVRKRRKPDLSYVQIIEHKKIRIKMGNKDSGDILWNNAIKVVNRGGIRVYYKTPNGPKHITIDPLKVSKDFSKISLDLRASFPVERTWPY